MISLTTMTPRAILASVRTIAVVGLSANPLRPSNDVFRFLLARGYACIGVNPGLAGRMIHGAPVFASLADIDRPIDMVDVFRASDAVAGLLDEVFALSVRPKVFWTQLGVIDAAAGAKAAAAGLAVIMDACPKIELSHG
jgi:predicted CoA-binding protein